ncbi:unnamed protein product [Calypogeia fissa]
MSSKDAPYATMHDLPKYQEREKVGSAPWERDERPAHGHSSTRVEPHYFSSSQTAPFATSDNLPIPRQRMVNGSPISGQNSAPGLPAGAQENRQKTSTAPWDRDESHYSAKIKVCGSIAKSAPFATELNKK